VAVPPATSVTVSLIEPVPDAVQVEPADATHDHVAPLSDDGRVSVTVAPVTVDGPLLVATIVYVIEVPGVAAVAPSVLVIDRSAVGVSVSVSVAELLPLVGSVTPTGALMVAVLTRDPVAVGEIVAVSV
jgi:hypothetical protein